MRRGTFVLLVLFLMAFAVFNLLQAKTQITGRFSAITYVGIIDQNEVMMYEEHMPDNAFEISFSQPDTWLSYNGTPDSTWSGRDTYDGLTQPFTLENRGSIILDVTISAEDFYGNGTFVEVDKDYGDFEIYIPGIGWKKIPDNSESDPDGIKEPYELCIANLLGVGRNITGFDFRIKGESIGNPLSRIKAIAYNSDTVNPCRLAGLYINPSLI